LKLLLIVFAVFVIDLIKNILAYQGIFLWKEIYFAKKFIQAGAIIWIYVKVNKELKYIEYLSN
jgi:hypothetical protein